MPTTNPRINVTVSSSLNAVVSRLAIHTRVSKSQVLRELLEAAEPALQRAVALMDAAATASAGLRQKVGLRVGQNNDDAQDMLAVLLSRLDRATGDLVSEAEAVRGKRPGKRAAARLPAAPELSNPPASNRGVKSTNRRRTTPSRATKVRAS